MLQMMIHTTAAGTVQFRFANNASGAGRTSTTRAGSTLLAREARLMQEQHAAARNASGRWRPRSSRTRARTATPRSSCSESPWLVAAVLVGWLLVRSDNSADDADVP